MTKGETYLLLATICPLIGSAATIQGVVVNAARTPINAAKVRLVDIHRVGEGIIQYVRTDSNGKFTIEHVPPGSYSVYAQKTENGYGDPAFAFFSSGERPFPEVKILADDQKVSIVVNLGAPGGHLDVSLVDADSGAPISKARYRLSLANDPAIYISSSATEDGRISTPVPARPLNLTVSAPDYESARLSDLRVTSGAQRNLTIRLNKRPPAK